MKFFQSFIILTFYSAMIYSQQKTPVYAIAIHGGAGVIPKTMPDSVKQNYVLGLTLALKKGQDMLKNGSAGLDVVETVVRMLEDNPLFNAGKGAVFTEEGTHELDAAIMDGKTMQCGAVAGVKLIKNPISLARRVMEKTKHVLLAGDGAEKFAREQGIEFADSAYFFDPRRFEQLQKAREQKKIQLDHSDDKKGTVGCVVLDQYGNLAAATSTGGMTNKMKGRIGDSPIIGAGTYANNKTCAVSCTGTGEQFIRFTIAFGISARMELQNLTLQQSAEATLDQLQKGDGGFIAVDKDGHIVMHFNSDGMFRGAADASGKFEVKIWE